MRVCWYRWLSEFLFCKRDVLADENSSNNDINDKIEYIKSKIVKLCRKNDVSVDPFIDQNVFTIEKKTMIANLFFAIFRPKYWVRELHGCANYMEFYGKQDP